MLANNVLYLDMPILNQCRNILPQDTYSVIDGLKAAVLSREQLCSVYIDMMCGHDSFVSRLYSQLTSDLEDISLIYKVLCHPSNNRGENMFVGNLLAQTGHAIHDIGTMNERLERLIKYFVYQALTEDKEIIAILMNNAHNLNNTQYEIFLRLIQRLKEEGIQLSLVLIGDTVVLRDSFIPNIFEECGIMTNTNFHIKPIAAVETLSDVLKYYDDFCTKEFFPDAYASGLRLCKDVNTLFGVFITISALPYLMVPLEILIQTIETCFRLYGSQGLQHFWPSKKQWEESISYTGYKNYINLF